MGIGGITPPNVLDAVLLLLLVYVSFQGWRQGEGSGRHDLFAQEFDAREGGSFRISLTYDAPNAKGKSAAPDSR